MTTEKEDIHVEGTESLAGGENPLEEGQEDRDPLLASGEAPGFKWYIAHAYSGFEHKVKKTLRENILNHKLNDSFSQIVIPEETVTTHADGKKRTMKKKLFPGYVLVRMIMNDRTWHLVKNTDKVTGFIGSDRNRPMPISDDEAMKMMQKSKDVETTKINIDFAEGDSVKVIEGPFKSFVGTIDAVNEKGKIRVQVSVFGRPTPLELDFSQVEKVK